MVAARANEDFGELEDKFPKLESHMHMVIARTCKSQPQLSPALHRPLHETQCHSLSMITVLVVCMTLFFLRQRKDLAHIQPRLAHRPSLARTGRDENNSNPPLPDYRISYPAMEDLDCKVQWEVSVTCRVH